MPRSERRRIAADLQRQASPVLQISGDDLTSGRALLGPGLRDAQNWSGEIAIACTACAPAKSSTKNC